MTEPNAGRESAQTDELAHTDDQEISVVALASFFLRWRFIIVVAGFLGAVAGLVGSGGNAGAVLAGFLFRTDALSTQNALLVLGVVAAVSSSCSLVVRFSPAAEAEQRQAIEESLAGAATVAG